MKTNKLKKIIIFCLTTCIIANLSLNTACVSAKAKKYTSVIIYYADKYCIERQFLFALIDAESGFNEKALSVRGAVGLMQIMPKTATYIALLCDYKGEIDLTDVDCNLTLGCEYINYLARKFQDETTLLCAYNAGEGTVFNWLKDVKYSTDGKTIKYIPFEETLNYVKKVNAYKTKYLRYLQRKNNYDED